MNFQLAAPSARSPYGLAIGGRSLKAASGREFGVANPWSGEEFARVPEGDAADVDLAVAAAAEGFRSWGATSAAERQEVLARAASILRARLPDIVDLEVAQIGRPIREMQAQLARLPEWFTYFGAVARTHEDRVYPFDGAYLNYSRRSPLGIVGLVTPWNHPLLILTKKLAPALAAGNAVVVKPSEVAPLSALFLADILDAAGLPKGAYNVVTGLGPSAGAALCAHPAVRKIDLTGGTETGRKVGVAAGERLVPFSAELGGKASVAVFDDAPLEDAVAGALFASFIATGQTCVQGARILVQRRIHDAFLERFVARSRAIRLGDPRDHSTQMGPMVSGRQFAMVERYVAIGKEEGAELAAGGMRVADPPLDRGFFYAPTIFAGVKNEMRIAQEEIFGPLACVIPFDGEEEAVQLANGTNFALAAAIWTRDVARAHRVAQRVEAGIVWVNDHHRIDPASPWGGFKDSGIGKENGIVCYESYTKLHSIVVNLSDKPFDWYDSAGAPQRYS
jgi:acyl-CoA reductase-like NAD-dependent aldehyde dehydrogenase